MPSLARLRVLCYHEIISAQFTTMYYKVHTSVIHSRLLSFLESVSPPLLEQGKPKASFYTKILGLLCV